MMVTRVVVGVDPTGAGTSAMAWGVREALVREVPLTAVRAWLPSAMLSYDSPAAWAAGEDLAAQVLAAEQLKLALEGVPGADAVVSSSEAVMGTPAQVLLDRAQGALLVVGSRGAGPFARAVVGSVSSSVMHHATTPVVLVPEQPADLAAPPRVVVGFDHSRSAVAAVQFGADLARRHEAELIVVLVQDPTWAVDPAGRGWGDDWPTSKAVEEASLSAALAAAGIDLHAVRLQVLTGHPASSLTSMTEPGDVLVLGSRGRGGFTGLLLGSTSTQCAQHAVCPVVVVPAPAPGPVS